MKEYLDKGKCAAPRWLVYPELSSGTIGWRMGYGEQYRLNEPPLAREFRGMFPQPTNWLFNPRKCKFDRLPFLAIPWNNTEIPKYSEITDDIIVVNDFITMDQEGEFRFNAFHFISVEHALMFSKFVTYHKCDPYKITFGDLKKGFDITDEQLEEWETFKYSICLNACYYKIMQDEKLKKWLLSTGDKCLVYISDDEWGAEENLFGFSLMEMRDELHRLYEHEDLIDWEYTRYLQQKNPYENPQPRNPNDRQSPEYKVVETVLTNSSRYVRDVNLKPELAEKYEPGQIITEKGFVDASDRIGGMVTTHRYMILSGYMADFSRFEEKTNWGLHVAKNNSRFKVLDVYTIGDKTQILLLQLPDGFDGAFDNRTDIEEEFIEMERENFKKELQLDVISDLADEIWLERCSFPLGMSDEGEFY